jgi:hypothetical protein
MKNLVLLSLSQSYLADPQARHFMKKGSVEENFLVFKDFWNS